MIRTRLLFLIFLTSKYEIYAQINPMGASYFQNQYLLNPATAGLNGNGLNLNLGSRRQWYNIPGSPSMQTITADFVLKGKAALGMNFNRDKAGLILGVKAMGTFAYHLPLNEDGRALSFGISMGAMNERINLDDVTGDQNDIILGRFNDRQTYLDGEFGTVFNNKKVTFQASIPNLKSFFKKDQFEGFVDRAVLFSALSYKFKSESPLGIDFEPKAAYRILKGMDNILDFGANFIYANQINFFGMYHTSQSATFGLGMTYQNFGFTGIYNTSTGNLSQYTNGNFEICLQARLFGKKK